MTEPDRAEFTQAVWDKLRVAATMELAVTLVTRIRDNFWPHMRVLRRADGTVVVTIYPSTPEGQRD